MKPTGPFLEVLSGMSEQDAEVEQVLGAARAWAEPSRETRERVAAALRCALPALPGASGPSPSLWPGCVAPPDGVQPRAGRASRLGRAPLVIIGGALIGALGFWLGHGVGYGAGQRDAVGRRAGETRGGESSLREPSAGPASRGESAARETQSPAPEGAASTEPPPGAASAPSTSTPGLPSVRAASKAPSMSTSGARRPALPATRVADAAPRAELSTPVEPARLSFRQVLDQLRRAQQQLRSGQATMSLLLLSELDRAAGDVLREERDATRVLALCAAGREEAARDVAHRLQQDSPRSIYGMRLEASCVSDPSE